ncbi:MAG: ABC transporter permease, partial [Phycisphaerae bacterium]|nr:ABC transporter permease [Gemmatimonadaceae bacterium]
MKPIRPGIRRLFRIGAWRSEDAARDLNDEMELHIALRAEQLARDGVTPQNAEAEARRLFALNDHTIAQLHDVAKDRNRHMRMQERFESIMQDTRYALRRLTREPAITAFIVGTLALGIGINVTAFSVVDRVLLRGPQHVREPERLVRLYTRVEMPSLGLKTSPFLPHSAFVALRDGLNTIDGIGAYRMGQAMVGSGASSEMRPVSMISSETFKVLGVQPIKGRFFGASEDADNVAVIGERYWKTTLAGDADIIGKSVAVDDVPHTIIGIAPEGFTGPELRRIDVWTPISLAARNSMNMHIVARLKPGVSADGVARDILRVQAQIDATLPRWGQWLRGAKYLAAPIAYDDNARESLESVMARWLAAISAIILFISCANVANLLLARLARRRRELAVRIALGSGRGRVVRLVAIEGALLAVGAAMLAFSVVMLVEPVVKGALFPTGSWAFTLL